MAEAKVQNFTMPSSVCYVAVASNPNNIWKSDDVLGGHAPLLALQVTFTILASNIFYYILRPLRQPRIVAEFLTGLIISPFCMGNTFLGKTLSPVSGVLNLETYGNMGLMFYVFLSGLEMNLDTVLQVRKKATSIAIAGIIIPMVIGMGLFAVMQKIYEKYTEPHLDHGDEKYIIKAYFFWSFALTVTGFPVLVRVLTDLKLLYTKLGRAALNAAMVSATFSWVLFIILIPFSSNYKVAIYSVLSTIIFILVCIFALRPLITRFIDRKIDLDAWDESQMAYVLMGVVVCSYITEMLGTHSIVGAFVYGLILPHGRFANSVMGKIDDFVSRIISPLFFFRTGLTVNLVMVAKQKYWPMVLIILLLSIPKVLSTVIATFFFGVPTRDGVGIGLLLNSKGVLAIVALNIAWERKILSVVAFSVMVAAVFLMTAIAPILISIIYKPRKGLKMYKLRTIQKLRIDSELRILSCVHNIRQASSTISIIEACNATMISPLHVFGVHLVELIGRATTFFASPVHQNSFSSSQNLVQSQTTELDSIANTFNTLMQMNNAVRVETLSAVSAYETIHEDIYNLAEQNRTTLILLPFHKQQDVEGGLETTNVSHRVVNQNVLQDAPCSVAVFVDRGLGPLSRNDLRVLMVFIGGPDDREALAIAWRMARHPQTQLSMVRILLSGEAAEDASSHGETQWLSCMTMNDEKQNLMDEEYVDSFRLKAVYNDESITYSEKEMNNSDELISILEELDKDNHDLYIVGQGNGRNSIVFSSYLEWCDNPELGVIGDIVASNSFGSRSSLLVVHQYGFGGMGFGTQTRHPIQLPAHK